MDRQKGKKSVKNTSMETVPLPTLRRLPYYYNILCSFEQTGFKYVSSAMIAKQMGIDDTQVRKDIASTGYIGKPKVGFNTTEFKEHLEVFLGMKNVTRVFLIGTGNLGGALAKYGGFSQYGLEIVELFDKDPAKIGQKLNNKEIHHINKLEYYIKKNPVKVAILTMHASEAQDICDTLVKQGVKAIWNFTNALLDVPDDVFVWNENLAASFIILSQFVTKKAK